MRVSLSFHLRSLAVALSLVSLFSSSTRSADDPSGHTPADRPMATRLIEAMVSHNQKPKLINVMSHVATRSPLFSDDYDWKEDDRVRKAIHELPKHNSEELWKYMVEHLNDDRYSFSIGMNDGCWIATIGLLCYWKADADLVLPYAEFVPYTDQGNYSRHMRSFDSPEQLIAWTRDHKDVPLYKQQIELCEMALKRFETLDPAKIFDRPLTAEEKLQFVNNVKQQIESLRQNKTPIFSRAGIIIDPDFYDAKVAMEIKEKYLKQQAEDKTPQN